MGFHHGGSEGGGLVAFTLDEHDVHDVVPNVPLSFNLKKCRQKLFST